MAKAGIKISDLENNPTLTSENSEISISFKQTRDSLSNPEKYSRFIKKIEYDFRRSRAYTNYKHHLMDLGFDRCFIQSNLTTEHCTIEMHHNILSLFDITFLICEHFLNTEGSVSTFDVIKRLKYEHRNNHIPIAMVSVTGHELNHNADGFHIHPKSTINSWVSFLDSYKNGITPEIANKLIRYLNKAISEGKSTDNELLKLRDQIYNWSTY